MRTSNILKVFGGQMDLMEGHSRSLCVKIAEGSEIGGFGKALVSMRLLDLCSQYGRKEAFSTFNN